MKKPQKRYDTANDIRTAIDKYRAKAQKLRDSANSLDLVADQFVMAGGFAEEVAFNREQANKKRESASRIERKTLTKLKDKLAEWQTPLLKGMPRENDRSVPVK